ncbi:hypothetical protein K8I85_00745, partial [bacterium]|nr:hypothetical protein [bacterium]
MSDPATWKRLESLLDELLELDAPARRDRLDALGEEDAALRAELERLLEADTAEATGVLDRGLGALAVGVMGEQAPGPTAAAGDRIGPY